MEKDHNLCPLFSLLLAMCVSGLSTTCPMCMATPVGGALTADIITHVHKTSHTWDVWKINFNVCPPSLCNSSGESSEVPAPRPEGTGGTVFYQGDIIVDSNVARYIYSSLYSSKRRHQRATVRMRNRLWKNGVVPYTFADTLTPMARRAVLQAFAHIHRLTCIRFRQKKQHDKDFIKFISDPGCWSGIGRVGGGQLLSLGTGCENVGTAVHEVTHSLGVWHEQARSDRDEYVHVLEENVSEKFLPDFQKIGAALATSRGYPYDYRSIMHYSTHAFTRNGKPTIEVTGVGKKLGMSLKSRSHLSNIDVAQLRDMYDCNLQTDTNETVCPKAWVKHDTSCYKFIPHLKKQFAAAAKYCEELNSHLVFIETKREDDLLAKRIATLFPAVTAWRTGGRVDNITNRMVWYREKSDAGQLTYSNWAKGHPDAHTSMVIHFNRTTNKTEWRGAWTGSQHQLPEFTYPFICERRARRPCLTLRHRDGRDYRGQLDHTVDGYTCQKWTEHYPRAHNLTKTSSDEDESDTVKEDTDGLGNHNYCRNPSKNRRSRPWCYTTKTEQEWQVCDVSVCSTATTTPPTSTQRPETRSSPSKRRLAPTSGTGGREVTTRRNPQRRHQHQTSQRKTKAKQKRGKKE